MLKENIKQLLDQSGITNKEIVSLLDEIRKDYHDRRNVGDQGLSSKKHSERIAIIRGERYTLSTDKYVFYKGGWRVIHEDDLGKYIIYLGKMFMVKIKSQKSFQ